MTLEETKDNIGEIVHHIGLGKALIAEVNEQEEIVVLVNPFDKRYIRVETFSNLHRLEIIEND